MKSSHRILAAIGLLLIPMLASYGCSAKPPEEEPKLAHAAMEKAKSVQAEKLAVVDWGQAMQSLADADKDVKINRFGDAKMFYLRAESRFNKAYTVAKARYDSLLKEVDENQTAIASHYGTLKARLASARVPAKTKKEVEATCLELDKAIAEVDKFRTSGNAIQAKLSSQEVLKKVYDTEKSLEKK